MVIALIAAAVLSVTASSASAQYYSKPTYSQVERLIATASGDTAAYERAATNMSFYSSPTFDQVERLIGAVVSSNKVSSIVEKKMSAVTVNGQSIAEGVSVTTYAPFKQSWVTASHSGINAFFTAVKNDPDVKKGTAFLGALGGSSTPWSSGNAEAELKVMANTSGTLIYVVTVYSTDINPYFWINMSVGGGSANGWRKYLNATTLSGKTYDFSTPYGVYSGLSDALAAMGATVRDFPKREWLRTDGKGYFITDYVPTGSRTKVEMMFRLNDNSKAAGLFMANDPLAKLYGKTASGGKEFGVMAYEESPEGLKYYCDDAGNGVMSQSVLLTNYTYVVTVHRKRATLESISPYGGRTTNSITLTGGEPSSSPAASRLVLFTAASWAYGTPEHTSKMDVAYVKIYDAPQGGTETLVHAYVPAVSGSGVATMYDTVSHTYITVSNVSSADPASFAVVRHD